MKNEHSRREFLKRSGSALAGILYLTSPLQTIASTKQGKIYDFYQDSEKTLMAKMLYGEARELLKEEDQKEIIMIGFTAINRASDRIKGNGITLKEAILKNKRVRKKSGKIIRVHQYSCFNSWDPNLEKIKNPKKYNAKAWEEALELSGKLLEGKLTHLNYGQDHYHSKNIPAPSWANSSRMKKIWGQPFFKHEFYKDTKA